MLNKSQNPNYKWVIMILGALTNAFVVAVPGMGMSVLLPEISKDLNLNLVQAGLVWGIGSLPMLFASLLAGTLCDRFGPKRILIAACLLMGLSGALRAFSTNFASLMVTVFFFGFFGPLALIGNLKNAVIWFPESEVGIANGLGTLGMAAGFFIGSMVSAAFLSPALGGWRNVFYLFGAVAALFSVPWFLTRPSPGSLPTAAQGSNPASFKKSMSHLAGLKDMWILGLSVMIVSGGILGVLGYLPLYLQGLGWSVSTTGGVLASFHIASMICVLPLTIWSDRLGSRRNILIMAALINSIGIALLSFAKGAAVWGALIMAGSVRDGFMAVFFTLVSELRGVGKVYSGMAAGFMMVFMAVGNLVAPPLGNSLAGSVALGAPLLFWAALVFIGGMGILLAPGKKPALESTKIAGVEEG